MKKSNKLLLGGVLIGLLLITSIHITLYAKYKNGDYTIYNAADDQPSFPMQTFSHIKFVSVRNVPEATVRFSDVAQVEKNTNGDLQYVQNGDTLLITGRDSANQQGFRNYVVFNLPHNATLSLFNSNIFFEAGKKGTAGNPVIYLNKSQVRFSEGGSPMLFNQLRLVASENSSAAFLGNTQINNLEVQLSNSSIEDVTGNIGGLSIVTDTLSRIALQTKHLLKATITPDSSGVKQF